MYCASLQCNSLKTRVSVWFLCKRAHDCRSDDKAHPNFKNPRTRPATMLAQDFKSAQNFKNARAPFKLCPRSVVLSQLFLPSRTSLFLKCHLFLPMLHWSCWLLHEFVVICVEFSTCHTNFGGISFAPKTDIVHRSAVVKSTPFWMGTFPRNKVWPCVTCSYVNFHTFSFKDSINRISTEDPTLVKIVAWVCQACY